MCAPSFPCLQELQRILATRSSKTLRSPAQLPISFPLFLCSSPLAAGAAAHPGRQRAQRRAARRHRGLQPQRSQGWVQAACGMTARCAVRVKLHAAEHTARTRTKPYSMLRCHFKLGSLPCQTWFCHASLLPYRRRLAAAGAERGGGSGRRRLCGAVPSRACNQVGQDSDWRAVWPPRGALRRGGWQQDTAQHSTAQRSAQRVGSSEGWAFRGCCAPHVAPLSRGRRRLTGSAPCLRPPADHAPLHRRGGLRSPDAGRGAAPPAVKLQVIDALLCLLCAAYGGGSKR